MKTLKITRKQTFTILAPQAARVYLAGDFTEWQKHPIPLHKRADGAWTAGVPLKPGTYHYRFLVDGKWCDDPQCKEKVANPFGTQDAVLVVGGGERRHTTSPVPNAPHPACEI